MNIPELPFPLTASGPAAEWSYEDGALGATAGPRQDRFVPPTGPPGALTSDAPRLTGPVAGDFQLLARVRVDFRAAFDAGVLYLHTPAGEWAKICLELSPELPYVCTVVTREHSDDANAFVVDGDTYWLRLSRAGRAFAYHASADGETWTFVRTFTLGVGDGPVEAGFLAQSPVGEGCRVVFDRIGFRGYGVKELRDGS
ncbi:DUF1349 domain-containing protein [Streptomyces boninensis]|uniref:DUF1349 domain-containing protein n=1 Tax=Streptomyces boninensis TaxID=2039455 RepID=UPI003B20EB68